MFAYKVAKILLKLPKAAVLACYSYSIYSKFSRQKLGFRDSKTLAKNVGTDASQK